ncbi:caspase domain-containing protein [Aspergillus parasiticus]|uniref:Caspase domain-containing protein n=1 Tax=Aspergillus parasiticus TaxID=5067 RepID=A0A5N6DR47_ASPPA|nr:caspase domain-containing protein [Aspergillus parasiticus]
MSTPERPSLKRALLIGCRTSGLRAIKNDLDAMSGILQVYGFEITRCEESDATRDGILHALDRLIESTRADDSVVVYYTGHGGITEKAGTIRNDEEPWRLQYLVPVDHYMSKKGQFHGILDVEFSYYLQSLTEVCHNVTVIMDCCHSNRMARGSHVDRDEIVKAAKPRYYEAAFAHLRSIKGQIGAINPFLEGNDYAIRISAAAAREGAFEYTDETGWRISALTQVLVMILTDALEGEISWRSVSIRLRDQMALTMPEQHPDIAVPVGRLLFSLDERHVSIYRVEFHPHGPPMLQAGRLHGVEEGDVYALLPYGSERLDKKKKVATATVTRITTTEAELSLDKDNVYNQDLVAFLEIRALKHWPISYNGVPAFRDSIREYIQMHCLGLRIADQGEEHLASVHYDGQNISVRDMAAVEVGRWPYSSELSVNSCFSEMIKRLNALGCIQNLARLESGADALNANIELGFGVVEEGRQQFIEPQSTVLHEGERIFFSVRNNSSTDVRVHLFEACAGELGLLSRRTENGRELMADGGFHTWGWNKQGQLTGWELPWPPHVGPETVSLVDTFILIVTDTPIDLSCLDLQRLQSSEASRDKDDCNLWSNLRHFGFGYDKLRLAKAEEPTEGPRYDIYRVHLKLEKRSDDKE